MIFKAGLTSPESVVSWGKRFSALELPETDILSAILALAKVLALGAERQPSALAAVDALPEVVRYYYRRRGAA